MVGLYKVLLIPAQDYLRHPHITRHHHIFENFDDRFKITVLNVRLRNGPKTRDSKHEVVEVGIPLGKILPSYILGFASFHLTLARLVKSNNYDCVVLSNIITPLIPLLTRGRPIVFDYKDVYSLSASVPFRTPVRQLLYWATRLFERILFSFHMTIVVPSTPMQHLVHDRFMVSSLLISNGVNTEVFHPMPKSTINEVRDELGVKQGEFCLCYLGSIESWIDLEPAVQALTDLRSLRLILVGGPPRSASYLQHILALCDREGVRDRVTWTGFRSQADAARIVGACDAAIVPFPVNDGLSAVARPDKVFEYLASGIPVISTKLPDVEKLFGDIIYFYDSPAELYGILRGLINGSSKYNVREQLSRAKEYDWKIMVKAYEELIARLVRPVVTSKIREE